MDLIVNGTTEQVPDRLTVAAFVAARVPERTPVAVALNGEVLPRGAWPGTDLAAGDRVELLSAVAGG